MTLIRGGVIIDGSGAPPRAGDVFIEGGIIREVRPAGTPPVTANVAEIIDVHGMTVCPGFIDMHRHADLAVFRDGFGKIELSQGITSCVSGNCGMAPVPNRPETRAALQNYLAPCLGSAENLDFSTHAAYAAQLKSLQLPLNIGFFAGMGALRIAVKGFDASPYTAAEMEEARVLLAAALDAGALGLSIGLMYVPEVYSSTDEIAALASVMKQKGGVLCTHMRWETEKLPRAVAEVIEIAKKAEVPLEISHFKAAGVKAWRTALEKAIELIEAERARGMDITVDFYPYDCGSSTMTQMLPPSFLSGGVEAALASLDKPENVAKLRTLLQEGEEGWDNLSQTIGWDRTVISSAACAENQRYLGKTVSEAAAAAGLDEAAFVAKLMRDESGRVAIINRSMSTEDIDTVARLSYSALISDALYGDMKNPHPRLFGAFPRFLRDFVFERKILPLHTAIHKMTAAPAARLGLKNRGQVAAGFAADLLVFDNNRFRDNACFENPAQLACAPDYVFVNGIRALSGLAPSGRPL